MKGIVELNLKFANNLYRLMVLLFSGVFIILKYDTIISSHNIFFVFLFSKHPKMSLLPNE